MNLGMAVVSASVAASLAFAAPTLVDPLRSVPDQVEASLFGMHAISPAPPSGIPGMATVRLWDTDTTWRVLDPARGVYRWDTLDARIQAAVDSGTTVLMVLGGTPAWAASSLSASDASWLGAGSASPPRSIPDWSAFVSAVVKRYGGRIEAYQIWNEPSDPLFWRGSWDTLARMTKAASDVIRAWDSNAHIVAAPLTLRGPTWREDAREYIDALFKRTMPVDVMSFHGYAAGPPGQSTTRPIRQLRHLLANSRAAGLPLWETEVNFTDVASQPSKLPSATERSWLARAYLDAVRLGVQRVYWYAYADVPDFLAIDIRKRGVVPAYSAVSSWIADSEFRGCSGSWQGVAGTTGCAFVNSDGRTAVTLWSDEPRVLTTGRGTARDLEGRTWSVVSALVVHDSPVWFLPSAYPG